MKLTRMLLLLLLFCCISANSLSAADRPPNVILVFMDDK